MTVSDTSKPFIHPKSQFASVKDMPGVTVEQVLRLRERAIELEQRNKDLKECLSSAMEALRWYELVFPDSWTENDNENMKEFERLVAMND